MSDQPKTFEQAAREAREARISLRRERLWAEYKRSTGSFSDFVLGKLAELQVACEDSLTGVEWEPGDVAAVEKKGNEFP